MGCGPGARPPVGTGGRSARAAPIPSKLRQAALWIALEMLFTRRGATPPERVAKAADGWREVLLAVGKGEAALAAAREGVPEVTADGDDLVVAGSSALRPAALERIRAAGGLITGITTEEGRLDSLYLELVGGKDRGDDRA